MTLGSRITLWIGGLTAALVLTGSWLEVGYVHQRVLSQFGGSERSGTAREADRLAARLERAVAAAERMAIQAESWPPEELESRLTRAGMAHPDLASVQVWREGKTTGYGLELTVPVGPPRTWSRIRLPGEVDLIAYAIKRGNIVVRIALADRNRWRNFQGGPYELVVDRQGRTLLGAMVGPLPDSLRACLGPPRVGPYQLADPLTGSQAAVFSRPVGQSGLFLLSVFPRAGLLASLHELELIVTLAGALTVLLLLLVIRIAAASLAHPLHLLAQAAGRISQGELEVDLPELRRNDEVGELRDAFQRMVTSLRGQFERARAAAVAGERVRRDFELAREIQLADPSTQLPQRPEIELSGRSLPAREVGGDVYDYFWVGSRWVFFYVADVEGKGVPAALHTVLTRRLLRALAQRGLGVASCLDELNEVLNQEEGRFVTLFMARLDVNTGELCYASAGHDAGWILSKKGKVRVLEGEPGLPVGIQPTRYQEHRTRLQPGEGLFLATDGLGEARNQAGEFFGPRLRALLELAGTTSATDLVEASLNSVLAFMDGAHQQDDLTVAALVFHGPVALGRNLEKVSKSNSLFERTPAVLEEFLSRPA